jgi:hypothetical protein
MPAKTKDFEDAVPHQTTAIILTDHRRAGMRALASMKIANSAHEPPNLDDVGRVHAVIRLASPRPRQLPGHNARRQ